MNNRITKTMRAKAGFTLVELIVVIAILGILAGVGTVGYSGYIKKANEAADQQLVAGVKTALNLAEIQGMLKKNSAVVLKQSGVTIQEMNASGVYETVTAGPVDDALKAAFGDGYRDTLKLKYDGWTGTAATANIANVNSSSFSQENLNALLGDVSILTNVLREFFTNEDPYDRLKDYADEMGIDKNNMQAMANLAVFDAARSINAISKEKNEEILNIYAGYVGMPDMSSVLSSTTGAVGMNAFSSLAMTYASMEGVINYISANGSDAAKEKIAPIKESWTQETKTNIHSAGDVSTLMNRTFSSITNDSELLKYYFQYAGVDETGENRIVDIPNTQAYKDGQAFLSYMAGVEESAKKLTADGSALNQSDYFRSEEVADTVDRYIAVSEVLNGSTDSTIVVLYDGVITCYPDLG